MRKSSRYGTQKFRVKDASGKKEKRSFNKTKKTKKNKKVSVFKRKTKYITMFNKTDNKDNKMWHKMRERGGVFLLLFPFK
jgi:hypothetical protein